MAKYLVTLYGEVKVEADSSTMAIAKAKKLKASKWRSYRFHCDNQPGESFTLPQRINNWWYYNVVTPIRALRGVLAVGVEMDKRLNSTLAENESMRLSMHQSQLQFHIDRLSEDNARLQTLVGKAVHLGFDPDIVPDNQLL